MIATPAVSGQIHLYAVAVGPVQGFQQLNAPAFFVVHDAGQ
jgi:hypothetical protein